MEKRKNFSWTLAFWEFMIGVISIVVLSLITGYTANPRFINLDDLYEYTIVVKKYSTYLLIANCLNMIIATKITVSTSTKQILGNEEAKKNLLRAMTITLIFGLALNIMNNANALNDLEISKEKIDKGVDLMIELNLADKWDERIVAIQGLHSYSVSLVIIASVVDCMVTALCVYLAKYWIDEAEKNKEIEQPLPM